MEFGKGLNSIRVRFTLFIGLLLSTGVALASLYHLGFFGATDGDYLGIFSAVTFMTICLALVYTLTGRLIKPIEQLKASTRAIAEGDFEVPVDVDCQCEIGGLADSFRSMVQRLNSNVTRIQVLAYEDGVTGLPNRAALNEALDEYSLQDGAIISIDIDQFKHVNDSLGHEAGDNLLRQCGQRIIAENFLPEECETGLQSTCAKDLYRFSGDEFIVLVREKCDEVDLNTLVLRILSVFDRPFDLSGDLVHVTATAGIAQFGKDSNDPNELLKFANMAVAEGKKSGRHRHRFFDDSIRARAIERAFLENDLRSAIQNDELRVHYQPKIDTHDQTIIGVEALVRWQHPEKGLLPPSCFIEIAESAGLIADIGMEVTRLAAQQVRKWQLVGLNWPVSINICPSQFAQPGFSENVLNYFRHIGLPTNMVELELTETIAMADPTSAAAHLEDFRDAGVKIAIDDYGTGYSNMAQLYKLPFDTLKIDRSLINAIGIDTRGEFIIDSIISMAKSLGHHVVAEGVETVEQYNFLKRGYCDSIQGYYFARPMEGDELVKWNTSRHLPETRKSA